MKKIFFHLKIKMELKTKKYTIPLLYVVPKMGKENPVDDDLTLGMEKLFNSIHNDQHDGSFDNGTFIYGMGCLGVHICVCGEASESHDYIVHVTPDVDLSGNKNQILSYLESYGVEGKIYRETKKSILESNPLNYATNTLCIHYLRYHRSEIPKKELDKVATLLRLYFK